MSRIMEDLEEGPDPVLEPSTTALRHENLNREMSPEPDLDLNLSRGMHQVWLVKVPKFLIEGWSHVERDDVPLGTVRVYEYVCFGFSFMYDRLTYLALMKTGINRWNFSFPKPQVKLYQSKICTFVHNMRMCHANTI